MIFDVPIKWHENIGVDFLNEDDCPFNAMDYACPKFEIPKVNAAGRRLVSYFNGTEDSIGDSIDIIDNWRASHSYPLNVFYLTLKNRAKKIHNHSATAQRIKRVPSIAYKLFESKREHPDKPMKLSQMQDIGGCRAIMPTIKHTQEICALYLSGSLSHEYLGMKDYISHPKKTGYRGIHLKYRYVGNGDKAIYSGMKIEVQLRTLLQHTWATAVEMAGTFTDQALKSNRGRSEWLRFFALMGSVFAIREGCPTVPDTPSGMDSLKSEIKELNNNYHIASVLAGYTAIIPQVTNGGKDKYFLVNLNPIDKTLSIIGFRKNESQEANRAYTEAEKSLDKDSPNQVVLASADSARDLRKAYPNYFLDTSRFLAEVEAIIREV